MPDESPHTPTPLEVLYRAIKDAENPHLDDPQLLLFIATIMGDVQKAQEAIDVYHADPADSITPRNAFILTQMNVTLP